jgi:hypothetical protein
MNPSDVEVGGVSDGNAGNGTPVVDDVDVWVDDVDEVTEVALTEVTVVAVKVEVDGVGAAVVGGAGHSVIPAVTPLYRGLPFGGCFANGVVDNLVE